MFARKVDVSPEHQKHETTKSCHRDHPANLHDTRDAWLLEADGHYRRVAENGISAQQALLARGA